MMQHSVWMMHFKLVTAMSAVVQFTQSPKFLSLQVKDAAIFNCELLGCAAKHYIWDRIAEFENGTQGFNEDLLIGGRISVSSSGTLRIENLTVFDNGLYYCRPIHLCVKNTPGATRNNGTRLTVTANTRETYWYSFAFLALPLILGCIYLLINFFRRTAATETSKPTDEDGNEMEIELQYSTLLQKNLKKYTSSQNENDFKCIYSEVKMKEAV